MLPGNWPFCAMLPGECLFCSVVFSNRLVDAELVCEFLDGTDIVGD